MLNRRGFLQLSAAATASLLLANCKGDTKFSSALLIPPLAEGKLINGVKHFDLSIQESSHSFFEGIQTDTYAVNGSYLGPTIRIADQDEVSLNFTNNLNGHTTMHGHGMHVPAVMDGGLHQIISPGNTWSARYKVNQRACTNWYHPHLKNFTAEQTYKGIAGLIIVDDEDSLSLDIPKTYGVDDIPLVLQDKRFDEFKQIDYSPTRTEIIRGYLSETTLVNGVIEPFVDVEAKEIRLRILNGSNSSLYKIGFEDSRNFKQIAVDNSFLNAPVTLNQITLSPGERAEIVIDLSNEKGNSLVLKDFARSLDFMQINVNKDPTSQTNTPDVLTDLPFYNPDEAVYTRVFKFEPGLKINGKHMRMNRIDQVIPINQLEIWEVYNSTGMAHNFHLHATHFTILDRELKGNVTNVAENEKGYKDTVFIESKERVRLLVKMTDYTDEYSPYMFHCHYLEHEDAGMMGQFTVV